MKKLFLAALMILCGNALSANSVSGKIVESGTGKTRDDERESTIKNHSMSCSHSAGRGRFGHEPGQGHASVEVQAG